MARITRGDIFLADLQPVRGHEQGGTRRVLIVSNEEFNKSETVIAMAITTQYQCAGYPLTFKLDSDITGKEAWIKISQIRTLASERLMRRVGHAGPDVVDKAIEALNEIVTS